MTKKVLKKFIVFALLLLMLYFLKGNITGFTLFEVQDENNIDIVEEEIPTPSLFFCPKDNCEGELYNFIDSAETSVHCALFDLDLVNIISLLDKKSKEIDVKLFVDNTNYEEIEENYKTVDFVKQDNNNQLSHNKFCIIDNKKISTGSMNPTERGAFFNNNNLILIESTYLAQNYEEEFQELWNGYFGKSNKDKQTKVKYPKLNLSNHIYENYFCPDDSCEEHVLEILNNAQTSINFMIFSFTSDPIGDLLVEKHNLGIEVTGVVEKTQNTNQYSEYKKLNDAGIDITYDTNKYNMHHKVFIIDESIVITGSYNPTASGTDKNDENILIIHDPEIAFQYTEEFNQLRG